MTAIEETVHTLKKELADVLKRYDIPLDDKTFILDKVDEAIASVMSLQRKNFEDKFEDWSKSMGDEREKVKEALEGMRRAAFEKIAEVRAQEKDKVEGAYTDGMNEGLSQAEVQTGPSTFHIILGLFFAALAFVVIAGSFFKKS